MHLKCITITANCSFSSHQNEFKSKGSIQVSEPLSFMQRKCLGCLLMTGRLKIKADTKYNLALKVCLTDTKHDGSVYNLINFINSSFRLYPRLF